MKKLLCGLMIVAATTTFSEVKMLTLEESIDLAYENSYTLKNADLDLENSILQVEEAYKEALPKINYSGSYTKMEDVFYQGSDGTYGDEKFSHSINLVQPIYRGGLVGAGIEGSKLLDELSNYQYGETKSGLRLSIISKYITILQLKESLTVYEESLKDVEGQLQRAERQYELKLIAKSSVLPFKTRVINTQTRIIETENQMQIAIIDLKNELKIASNVEIELEELSESKYDLSLINLEEDIKYARENNRDSVMANINSEVTELNEAQAKAAFLPIVNFVGGFSSDGEDLDNSAEEWDWSAGVSVEMNLFSFGQDVSALKRSKNATEKAKNNENQIKDNIEQEVRSNYLDIVSLEGTIAGQEISVESAQENYNLEKRRYENGLTDVVDFLAIETALRQAELTLIQSKLSYYFAYENYIETLK